MIHTSYIRNLRCVIVLRVFVIIYTRAIFIHIHISSSLIYIQVNKALYDKTGLIQLKDTTKGFPSARPVGMYRVYSIVYDVYCVVCSI